MLYVHVDTANIVGVHYYYGHSKFNPTRVATRKVEFTLIRDSLIQVA